MRMPIRGIQVLLVAAFFAHIIGWSFDLPQYFSNARILEYDGDIRLSFWAAKLQDLAYGVFYLGEAVIIEVLMRIWVATRKGD
jgi:hypothetical protein